MELHFGRQLKFSCGKRFHRQVLNARDIESEKNEEGEFFFFFKYHLRLYFESPRITLLRQLCWRVI